ncbi:MAG: Holliday junction resolvase RuvX [Bacteroidota bacterium]|nr:Holliday junction resolvase RuvX [Bacteroidota bacterium]
MGRILAIDYGRKRSGIAITDSCRIIANPLECVRTHDIMDFLQVYIDKENVDCFVVGEARQMNNEASESSEYIEPFVKNLRRVFPDIPIERIDERFTSKIATRTILDMGTKKKQRQDKGLVDLVSATLILQSYLEKINNM